MSCERALPLLYDLVDGDIAREDAIWLAGHVAACAGCARRLTEMRDAEAVYAREIPVEPPEGLAARISEAVRREAPAPRPNRSWEPVAAFLFLAVLIAAALLAPDLGGSAGSLAPLIGAVPRLTLKTFLELGRAVAAAGRVLASGLPDSAAGVGWTPLAAAAVALQIAGSAWLLGGRRAARPEAR